MLKPAEKHQQYVTANGNAIEVLGTVILPIILRDYADDAVFVVADITPNIIGYNLLRDNDLVLIHNPPRLVDASTWEHDKGLVDFMKPVPTAYYANPFLCMDQDIEALPYHYPLVATTQYYTRDPVQLDALDKIRDENAEATLAKFEKEFPKVFGIANNDGKPKMQSKALPIKCHINLDDKPFLPSPTYPVPLKYRERIIAELHKMVEEGVVRFTKGSRYLSSLLVVPKHNGELRPCSDFRNLNSHTIPESYPLPRIDELKLTIHGSIFTTLDLKSAYYNIAIAEVDITKTATATPIGVLEYTRMCFGLKMHQQYFKDALMTSSEV